MRLSAYVGLLHFSSTSIPAPSARPPPNTSAKISEIDPDNPASIPRPPHSSEETEEGEDVTASSAGFQQLKLICVKYLGIVSFQTPVPPALRTLEDATRSEQVELYQDSIRETGGLGLLLGMCQIDGRNPSEFSHLLSLIDRDLILQLLQMNSAQRACTVCDPKRFKEQSQESGLYVSLLLSLLLPPTRMR